MHDQYRICPDCKKLLHFSEFEERIPLGLVISINKYENCINCRYKERLLKKLKEKKDVE